MKQNDVQIGMTARVKIGQRLAEVKVLREIDLGGWKNRRRFECRTVDTGRLIKATAARLRPIPPPRVEQLVRQMVAAAVARADDEAIVLEPTAGLEAWADCPVGAY
jgi:hypothetical protein